ncbi:MAG TPA: cyclase [Candidatus Binatia bacterium]|nr:cyclase [Candidatus Binatia bacterium]
MVAVIVRHRVRDYDAWKSVFDEGGELRRRHGALGHQLYRVSSEPQELISVNLFKDAAGAQAFGTDPSLREAMERGGVLGAPDVAFCEQVEVVEYPVAVA